MAISGHDPWGSKRKSSPIHEVAAVDTAVLILHGEKDERVPVGQSVGFWRGLKRKATERGKKTAELIVYPREPHGFVERENAEDVMRRVLVHFNTHKNRASLGSPLSCPTSHMLCVPQGVEACGGKHLGVSQLFIPLGSFYSSDYQFLVYLTFGSRKTRTGEVVLSFIINPFDTQNENATRWQKSSSAPHKMSRNDPSF